MEKKVLIPIAQGTEEIEAVVVIDILRRSGINVKVAGETEIVTCSRGVKIIPDVLIEKILLEEDYDAIILPGGSTGVENLLKNTHLEDVLKNHSGKNKIIAAICAAPTILSFYNLIPRGRRLTSHPSVRSQLQQYNYLEDKVVHDDNIITSRGAGTAFEFAFWLVEVLLDTETALKIAKDIIYT